MSTKLIIKDLYICLYKDGVLIKQAHHLEDLLKYIPVITDYSYKDNILSVELFDTIEFFDDIEVAVIYINHYCSL